MAGLQKGLCGVCKRACNLASEVMACRMGKGWVDLGRERITTAAACTQWQSRSHRKYVVRVVLIVW